MNATQLIGALVGFLFLQGLMGFFWWYLKKLGDKKPESGNGTKAAGRTANEWDNKIQEAVERALYDTAPRRHEELRKLMKETLEQEFVERNEKLKMMMKEVIGEWLDLRFPPARRSSQRP